MSERPVACRAIDRHVAQPAVADVSGHHWRSAGVVKCIGDGRRRCAIAARELAETGNLVRTGQRLGLARHRSR
jgi:hypothetical protein